MKELSGRVVMYLDEGAERASGDVGQRRLVAVGGLLAACPRCRRRFTTAHCHRDEVSQPGTHRVQRVAREVGGEELEERRQVTHLLALLQHKSCDNTTVSNRTAEYSAQCNTKPPVYSFEQNASTWRVQTGA